MVLLGVINAVGGWASLHVAVKSRGNYGPNIVWQLIMLTQDYKICHLLHIVNTNDCSIKMLKNMFHWVV